jgi:hypothetical protein
MRKMTHRRRATITATSVFALGAAFAAAPTSHREDWGQCAFERPLPWTPGGGRVMSAHEPNLLLVEPPR